MTFRFVLAIIVKMITLVSCPVCSSKNISKYHESGYAPVVVHQIMPNVFVDALVVTNYFKCLSCNVLFQNPRMSDSELKKFYSQGYYRKVINLTDKEKDQDEKARADTDSKIIIQKLGKIKSHLDVGCSRGYLLRKVGAVQKIGVDEDNKNVTLSGIKVHKEIDDLKGKKFDLVSAIHTLEHVPDPISFLKSLYDLVSDGGHLVLEVPTWKSPGGPLRLPHLYHFEPDVLRLLCRQVGLKVIDTEFTPHLFLICRREN